MCHHRCFSHNNIKFVNTCRVVCLRLPFLPSYNISIIFPYGTAYIEIKINNIRIGIDSLNHQCLYSRRTKIRVRNMKKYLLFLLLVHLFYELNPQTET